MVFGEAEMLVVLMAVFVVAEKDEPPGEDMAA